VNIKIAGKWMFIPLKMVLIGIDPYPFDILIEISFITSVDFTIFHHRWPSPKAWVSHHLKFSGSTSHGAPAERSGMAGKLVNPMGNPWAKSRVPCLDFQGWEYDGICFKKR